MRSQQNVLCFGSELNENPSVEKERGRGRGRERRREREESIINEVGEERELRN